MRGGNSYLKYWLLAASLGLAVGSLQLTGLLDPLVTLQPAVAVVVMVRRLYPGQRWPSASTSSSPSWVCLLGLELWEAALLVQAPVPPGGVAGPLWPHAPC